jgi:hypothetical protein
MYFVYASSALQRTDASAVACRSVACTRRGRPAVPAGLRFCLMCDRHLIDFWDLLLLSSSLLNQDLLEQDLELIEVVRYNYFLSSSCGASAYPAGQSRLDILPCLTQHMTCAELSLLAGPSVFQPDQSFWSRTTVPDGEPLSCEDRQALRLPSYLGGFRSSFHTRSSEGTSSKINEMRLICREPILNPARKNVSRIAFKTLC